MEMNQSIGKENDLRSIIFKKFKKVFHSIDVQLSKIGSQGLGWFSIVLFHLSTFPTLIALLVGTSGVIPSVDVVLFIWMGLLAIFFKSLIEKNFLYITTNCLGFAAQTALMGLILFK